ncbi:ribosomal protein S18-alanine N-acetyltransferase [Pseudodesulfovibrio sp.]|uniref:ribosomal protein S18-alanine N-acetyltransferase n=1 Tax=unclassified Pseudodesulfovibrio TaxID=2661612 RepID=UPI003AFF89D4
MSFEVVLLDESSLEDVVELEKACFAYHWTREQFLMGLKDGIYVVLGAKEADFLTGYIAFSVIEDEMEILNLAVSPDRRRLGVGTALLRCAMELCKLKGVAKSFLDVKESNVSAQNLYNKFGYVQIGIRKRYYPDTKEDALLFRYDFI